jgi:ketosteroid isomerase-like protein
MPGGSARDRLLERDATWAKIASDGGAVDEILSYWTDDAIVIPAGMPAVIGKDALRAYVEGSLAVPGFRIGWSSSDAEVSGDETLGFVLSSNEISFDGADGQPVVNHGRAVTVWRRVPDGEWRCAVDIWNAEPD